MMKEKWIKLSTRVSGMTLRERVFIFLAMAVATLAIVQTMVVDGLQLRKISADARLQGAESAIQQIEQQRMQLTGPAMHDPDQVARDTLAAQEARLAELNAGLAARGRTLVPPERMREVLRDVVRGQSGVRIAAFKTLSPQPVALLGAAEGTPPGFYRHGFEVTVQGQYADLVAYLERLEALPWNLNWIEAKLDASARPELSLTLVIHTLSLEEAWLRV